MNELRSMSAFEANRKGRMCNAARDKNQLPERFLFLQNVKISVYTSRAERKGPKRGCFSVAEKGEVIERRWNLTGFFYDDKILFAFFGLFSFSRSSFSVSITTCSTLDTFSWLQLTTTMESFSLTHKHSFQIALRNAKRWLEVICDQKLVEYNFVLFLIWRFSFSLQISK